MCVNKRNNLRKKNTIQKTVIYKEPERQKVNLRWAELKGLIYIYLV